MATLLDSLTVPLASGCRRSCPSHPASPFPAVANYQNYGILTNFKGLRTQTRSPRITFSSSKRNPRIIHRGIVAETRDTAVEVPAVTDSTWQSLVIEGDLPVLVEFWAPWCGPCRMIHPVIDDLARQYVGKLKCFKLNTDESPSVATKYGIRSIPTVMIFKNGEKKDAIIGAVPKSTLTASIEKFLER